MALHYTQARRGVLFYEGGIASIHEFTPPRPRTSCLEIESGRIDYSGGAHLEKPAVEFEDLKYREAPALKALADRTWFYDSARKNLHVRVKVKAGEDLIINLSF